MSKIPPFIIFLTIFLALYGLLHFYFYRKMTVALEIGGLCYLTFVIFLCVMLFSPIIIHTPFITNSHQLETVLSYISYIWMAVLFLFFSLNILIDFFNLLLQIAARTLIPGILNYVPAKKTVLITTLIIIGSVIAYGIFEAGHIAIEKVYLETTKLPSNMNSLRIVQISDTHFSAINGVELARKIRRIVTELKPHLLVATGDIADRGLRNSKEVISVFKNIRAPYGKFAATGNHEFISGIENASDFIEKAGFRLLRNEGVIVGGFMNIAAVDDPSAERYGVSVSSSEDKVIKSFSPEHLNIFLKHQPRVRDSSIGKFDMQLSGHTHKGQIFPFTLIVNIFYPYLDGLFDLGKGSYLYVSRGTGTWGPPVRFLTFPEITLIEFTRTGNNNAQ